MTDTERVPPLALLHHVAIETADLDNCALWYQEFLGFTPSWTLTEFSELTRSRLPGITRLTEVAHGPVRLHLFSRVDTGAEPCSGYTPVQHVCLAVPSAEALEDARSRWVALFESGRFQYARPDGATPIVTDSDGVSSFYAYDVNGLELELTYVPAAATTR
jgi:catechol 2,3-dioxygenase-like lactoylglutathione lyase family enzyme